MKAILIAASLCLIAAEAHAISRYDPTRMSCGEVQARVAREGAVILRYRSPRNPNMTLYDRYVRSDRMCPMEQKSARAYVPSADARACPVRKCEPREDNRRFRRLWPMFPD
ncbi:hypothetical protein ASD64_06845 [Mesorhizobium sp. Root157]|uniref:hypothetical protein n=1 Tax=Mesorhizobium sp. Root157 TaxID=1736477 RepID=UPI0006F4629F|nr:hypothetical protein [Mesorhizobium sp. Root157]KQZ87156.1 hypothetical protein ASD64_06845 [Mesorhizobium sp. Root157]